MFSDLNKLFLTFLEDDQEVRNTAVTVIRGKEIWFIEFHVFLLPTGALKCCKNDVKERIKG